MQSHMTWGAFKAYDLFGAIYSIRESVIKMIWFIPTLHERCVDVFWKLQYSLGGLACAMSWFWLCFAVDDISLFKDFVDHISLLRKLINEMFPSEKMCK